MLVVLWAAAVCLAYKAVGLWLLLVIDRLRRRKPTAAVVSTVGLCAVCVLLARAWNARSADQVFRAAAACAAGLAGFLWLRLVDSFASKALDWREKKLRNELSRQIKLHLALLTGAAVFSVPFYWLVTTSLKPDERTNIFPPDLIPMTQRTAKIGGEDKKVYLTQLGGTEVRAAKLSELPGDMWRVRILDKPGGVRVLPSSRMKPDLRPVALWSNYRDALDFLPPEYRKGWVPLWNTVYVTALVIVGTVLSSSLVAFAFARLRWPGRDLLFVIMIATMMVPGAVTMLPVFLIYRALGWIDTLRPLWFGALFGGGFNIFLLRQFFLTIPTDLEDAAKIDGCSYFRIYWNIMLPLIKPALAALTIFAFMGSWNNFMGPLIYISSPEKMTLAYALQLFQGAHGGEPAMMMAAATLVMLPVLAVFFFTQRYMIQGVTLTGLKS